MRLSFRKFTFIGIATLALSFFVYQIFSIYNSARQTLADERARLIEQNKVAFEKRTLTPHLTNKIQIRQSANNVRDFVRFKDSFFAATDGGLLQFDETGKPEKHFSVLDALPESDLTALAVFQDKLFIGTQTKNLVAFDGEKFEQYVFSERKIQAVTAFLETDGKLLIGTFAGGLLEFDGAEFAEIKAADRKISAVNCLFKTGDRLYVGTFDNGLWVNENGVWTNFTRTEGLPSNRVVGIAAKDKNLYAATDLGLAVLETNRFRAVEILPAASSLLAFENRLFLTRAGGEIFTFDNSLKELSARQNLQNARLIAASEKLFLLADGGIFYIDGARIKPFRQADDESLTGNFVSALAADERENLWVGNFRRGIDVFDAEGRKIKHLETEAVREINFLRASGAGSVSAATGAGLITFKTDFSGELLAEKDGLPSNSVTHFSEDFTATAKGLAFRENGKIRALSALNGLPNNSVYAVLQAGKKLYAGTLGGLAEIENRRVARVWKASNSNLKTNWVTALARAGERIFIGTYGGGIFELQPSGEIRSFETEAGKFVVNPNALFADATRLYAGTLDGARVLNLQTQDWRRVKDVLPAETVMSVTGDERHIYFGTTNGIARIEKNYFTSEELQ